MNTVAQEQKRIEDRDKRISALPLALAEARNNAIMVSDVKLKSQASTTVAPKGPSLPDMLTGLVHEVPAPKLDNLVAHTSRVQRENVVGTFCQMPIVTLDELGVEVDVAVDQGIRLRNSSGTSIAPELLPGEVICADNIIRRENVEVEDLASWSEVGKKIHLFKKGDAFVVSTVLLRKGYYAPKRFTGEVISATLKNKETGEWEPSAVKVYADDFIFLNEGETHPEELYTTHVGRILYKEFSSREEAMAYVPEEEA